MPTEPNIVGTPLAMRQTRMAVTGSISSAISMLAGMATAVPKPAMPSMKFPKPQTMMSAWTRRSSDTRASPLRIVAIAPDSTVTA